MATGGPSALSALPKSRPSSRGIRSVSRKPRSIVVLVAGVGWPPSCATHVPAMPAAYIGSRVVSEARECLIDDGDRRTLRLVGAPEVAAVEEGASQRVEKAAVFCCAGVRRGMAPLVRVARGGPS